MTKLKQKPSPRKIKGLTELLIHQDMNSKFNQIQKKNIMPGITLKEVRKILSKCKSPMSEEVINQRKESKW